MDVELAWADTKPVGSEGKEAADRPADHTPGVGTKANYSLRKGDMDPSNDTGQREDINTSAEWLTRILEELQKLNENFEPADPPPFFVLPYTGHTRVRVLKWLLTATAAGTITINIGTRSLAFNVPANDVVAVELPMLIDRGTDVTVASGAPANTVVYMVADIVKDHNK